MTTRRCVAPLDDDGVRLCGRPAVAERTVNSVVMPLCAEHAAELDEEGKTMTTYKLAVDELTVYAIDEHGEPWDLTQDGERCKTIGELREFVLELSRQQHDDGNRVAILALLKELDIEDGQDLRRIGR